MEGHLVDGEAPIAPSDPTQHGHAQHIVEARQDDDILASEVLSLMEILGVDREVALPKVAALFYMEPEPLRQFHEWINDENVDEKNTYILQLSPEQVEILEHNRWAAMPFDPLRANDICQCGHPYYRHYDSYDNNAPVGCKYCDCYTFKEKPGGLGDTVE